MFQTTPLLFFHVTLTLLIAHFGPYVGAAKAQPMIYDAEAIVQSHKRGVAANYLHAADYEALSPGVSWRYNWATTPGSSLPGPGVNMDFVPMVWTNNQGSLDSLSSYLASGNQPRQIFVINEPNLRGQAFITPEQTAIAYKQVKAIAEPYGIPVTGPHMSAGSSTNDSITAPDPITGQPKTYTYMGPFVEDFLHYMGNDPVDSIGYHFYDNIYGFSWLLGEAKQYSAGRPVWITEFNWWDSSNTDQAVDYLVRAVDEMEADPDVEGYSWFKERGVGQLRSLLTSTPGELTELGEAYVNMPVHDDNVWYRPNGRLQAERYVDVSFMEISATDDADGLADMAGTRGGAWLDYNIYAEQAGQYEVSLRMAGESGLVQLLDGEGSLHDSVFMTAGGWQTLTMEISLKSGYNRLRLNTVDFGQVVNWLEFEAVLTLSGDYNGDGVVDAADYTVWRDGNSPDDSQAGYDLWVANYGTTLPTTFSTTAHVPEPVAVVTLLLACVSMVVCHRVY